MSNFYLITICSSFMTVGWTKSHQIWLLGRKIKVESISPQLSPQHFWILRLWRLYVVSTEFTMLILLSGMMPLLMTLLMSLREVEYICLVSMLWTRLIRLHLKNWRSWISYLITAQSGNSSNHWSYCYLNPFFPLN